MKQENIEKYGKVVEDLSNSIFRVERMEPDGKGGFDETGHIIQATISGKIRIKGIRILPGDYVKVTISPYDFNKGIIVYRINPYANNSPEGSSGSGKKGKGKDKGKGKKK
jgi:translation initiation factor IF-1